MSYLIGAGQFVTPRLVNGPDAVHQRVKLAGPYIHDVGPAHELTLHIKLGDRRPVGKFLDALAELHVLQRIDPRVAPACDALFLRRA